jgi:hypothetical protein
LDDWCILHEVVSHYTGIRSLPEDRETTGGAVSDRSRLSDSAVGTLRIASLVTGSLGLLVAILADQIGLSVGQGISVNQIIIGILGLSLILAGISGRRFPSLYKGFSLLLLNILVCIVIMDALCLVLLKLVNPEALSRSEHRAQIGADDPFDEARMSWGKYAPYVVWKADTSLYYKEEVGPDGFRMTPGSVSVPEAYRIFVLGGSTVWGVDAPDSATIPSRILGILSSRSDMPLDVRNMGQYGWVSTQEMLELILHIRNGDIPDLVILLDGMNDVAASYQSGIAGVHQNYPSIVAQLESDQHDESPDPIRQLVLGSNTYILLSQLVADAGIPLHDIEIINYESFDRAPDELSWEIAEVMLANYEVIRGLAEQWEFDVAFFIQPSVWTGAKSLTTSEMTLLNGGGGGSNLAVGADPSWIPLLESSYAFLEASADTINDLFSLVGVFDGVDSTVFTDNTGVHIIPDGNRMIAEEMVRQLDSLGYLEELYEYGGPLMDSGGQQ